MSAAPETVLVVDDDDVSREHCRIVPRDDGYVLLDAGSTNGTFVGDARLEPDVEVALGGGEQIRIGSLIFKFLDGCDIEALYHEEIYRLTIVDGLTGLHNRRYFDDFMRCEVVRWRRYRRRAVNDESKSSD